MENQRHTQEIDESIRNTIDQIDENITNKKYKNINCDFFRTFFEILIDIMAIIEEYNNGRTGYIKKQIVVEIGQHVIEKYFPTYISYYQENVDDLIETVINSYKLLSHFKTVKQVCCFPKC